MSKNQKERTWESNGMIWNDGDEPHCNYCNKHIDEVETLHETPYSGDLCCESEICRNDLVNNMLYQQVEETTK